MADDKHEPEPTQAIPTTDGEPLVVPVQFLREYESVIDTADIERFLATNDPSNPAANLRLRNAALKEIADRLKDPQDRGYVRRCCGPG
jgi:hypothetical protein